MDDIIEMYSKLRYLVLEYLGIPPTPTKQPSDMDASLSDEACAGLPYTERRGQSAPVPSRRSWSRPSITDSCEVMRSNIPAAMQTKSPPAARSSVEAESIRRRQSALKDALVGRSLQTYSQQVNRVQRASTCVPTVRQTDDRPSYSAPVGAGSQSTESCVVAEMQPATAAAPVASDESTVVRRRLADETVLDLTTPTTQCRSVLDVVATPAVTPRQSLSRRASDTASRPGSAHHPVLPPIRQLRSADTVVTVGADAGQP